MAKATAQPPIRCFRQIRRPTEWTEVVQGVHPIRPATQTRLTVCSTSARCGERASDCLAMDFFMCILGSSSGQPCDVSFARARRFVSTLMFFVPTHWTARACDGIHGGR